MNVIAFTRPREGEGLSEDSGLHRRTGPPEDLNHREAVSLTMVMKYLERADNRSAARTGDPSPAGRPALEATAARGRCER